MISSLIEQNRSIQILIESARPGQQVYLVGGAVRDLLLNQPMQDMDFCLTKPIRPLARDLAEKLNAAMFVLDEDRETYRIVEIREDGSRFIYDLAGFRGDDLESDLRDRDFTINAMALDIQGPTALIDPMGGAQDLKDKILRVCSLKSFENDPLRVLRAVRQSVQLSLRIDSETLEMMKKAIPGLERVSMERQRDEILKMLANRHPAAAFGILERTGILGQVLPELREMKGIRQSPPHILDVWEHTIATLKELERVTATLAEPFLAEKSANLWAGMASLVLGRYRANLVDFINQEFVPGRNRRGLLFLGALLHDSGKPSSKTVDEQDQSHFYGHEAGSAENAVNIARRLKLAEDEARFLETLVQQHMRIHQLAKVGGVISRRSIYRFFKAAGETAPALILLSLADTLATYGLNLTPEIWQTELEISRQLLNAWFEEPEVAVHPPRFITGDDIIQVLELQPGRMVGQILAIIQEKQACGEIQSRQAALESLPKIYGDLLLAEGEMNDREV